MLLGGDGNLFDWMAIAANFDWGLVALVEDGCVIVLITKTGSGPGQKQFATDWVAHLQARSDQ